MEPKVEAKLLQILSRFVGNELRHARLENHKINGKKILVLKLEFDDGRYDDGICKTMVLALDKDITESDYKYIGEKLCQ